MSFCFLLTSACDLYIVSTVRTLTGCENAPVMEVVMYEFEFNSLVQKAAERLKRTSGSHADFLRITQETVRGTGIKDQNDLKRITTKLRSELTTHSARARSSRAQGRKIAEGLAKRMNR